MNKPQLHILVCASFRSGGDMQGVCHKKGSADLLPYLENEIVDRELDAVVTSTGCLKACDHGPVMVIHPQNQWYARITAEEMIDEILDAVEDGQVAARYLIEETKNV